MAYDIIPYRPDLKTQVADLQRHLWCGDRALNTAYLEWKYERNPYFETPRIYLAVHEGRVVGMRGMFGSCWEIGAESERVCLACADDFVIAPPHRRHGLVGRIMAAALDDLAARGHRYALSLSAAAVTLAESLAGGWRAVGPVLEERRYRLAAASWRTRLARRLGQLPYLWRWASVVSGRRGPGRWSPFQRFNRAAARSAAAGAVWSATEPPVGLMAQLVRRLGHDGRARHVRDEPYLSWRFANPLHEYRFLLAGTERLTGYLVLQAHRLNPVSSVHIVDWEAETTDARRALLEAALEWGQFVDLRTWVVSLPAAVRDLLREKGFVPAGGSPLLRHGPRLLIRALVRRDPDPPPVVAGRRLLEVSSWDMRMLYSMAG